MERQGGGGGGVGGYFPVAHMGREEQPADTVVAHGFQRVHTRHRYALAEELGLVDMRIFTGDAAQVFPHAAQDGFALGPGFLGKGAGEVVAADAGDGKPWSDHAHQPSHERRGRVHRQQPQRAVERQGDHSLDALTQGRRWLGLGGLCGALG